MAINESKCLEKANKFNLNTVFKSFKSLEIRQKWSTENKLLTVLKNFAQNVFKWHYFDQVYSRFTRDGKMAFFTSQTRPLRRETSQRRQPEVFLAVISLPLAVTDVCRRQILSRLMLLLLSPLSRASIKPGTRNILKHAGTCRSISENPGTSWNMKK